MTLKSLTAVILPLALFLPAIAINYDHTINEQVEITVLDGRIRIRATSGKSAQARGENKNEQ